MPSCTASAAAQHYVRFPAFTSPKAVIFPSPAPGAPAQAQRQTLSIDSSAPVMSGVSDVLGGQKYLLQDQDLELLQVNLQNGIVNTQMVDVATQNSQVVGNGVGVQWSQSIANPPFQTGAGELASEAAGRMFYSSDDTLAVEAPTGTYFLLRIMDVQTGWNTAVSLTSSFTPGEPGGPVMTHVVMGDFTGNGYSDVLAFYGAGGAYWGMRVVAANDPNDESSSVTMGPEFLGQTGNYLTASMPRTFAIGDFNNDGRDEIAVLLGDGQTIAFYSVDPKSLAITQTGTYTLPVTMDGVAAMVAGRFRDCGTPTCRTNADLALVGPYASPGNGSQSQSQVGVIPVQITPQSNGTFTAQAISQPGSTPFFNFPFPKSGIYLGLIAQAAPLANSPKPTREQLVIGLPLWDISEGAPSGNVGGTPWAEIEIGSFLPAGNDQTVLGPFSWESETPLIPNRGILFDVKAGNFDNQNSDGTHNPALQIATYTAEGGGGRLPHIRIYHVAVPSPFPPEPPPPVSNMPNWLSAEGDYAPSSGPVVSGHSNQLLGVLLPADLEGRSLRLGPPMVVTVPTQTQPDLVLGMPPMHVGWLTPGVQNSVPGCKNPDQPCIFNLTMYPSVNSGVSPYGFASRFSFSSGSDTNTKQASTTSWGISVLEKISFKATWGDGINESSFGVRQAAKYAHDHNVKKTYDHYSGVTRSDQATTVTSDYVFYTQKAMNAYFYPILGQQDCSSGTCKPQYVEYSVPDKITHAAMNGNTLWWYQPVHQPGNVLSYPPDITQLQDGYTDTIVPLTANPPTCVGIGTANTSYSTTWTAGSGGGTTTGTSNAFSYDVGFSYSKELGIPEDKGKFKISLDVGGWGSFNSLNENYTSLSSSKGVTVTEPEFRNSIADCCGYGWGNLVFGLKNPVNPSAQTPADIVTDPDGNPVPSDGASTGPMFVGFLADVLTSKPGGLGGCNTSFPWWQQTYTRPDIALNHPSRWSWNQSTQTVSFNAPANPQQVNVLDQPFYQMKGFFISKQGAPQPAPNLPDATAGDQLNLTVRVYNYSLVDTTAPVHVRIYGQPYCSSGNIAEPSSKLPAQSQPCNAGNLCGNAFEIGETAIGGIPGFKSDSNGPASYLPNWTTATVPFDTTNYSGDFMVFWVVVWMQDANGNLIPEMPDKGLTAVPGAGITDISQIPIQAHSNNVGLYGDYHQFHINPSAEPGASASPGSLVSASIQAPAQDILNERAPVVISVQADQAAPAEGVNVAYYDGNPSSGGALLNFQRITHIEPGLSYTLRNPFVPTACGAHTLYATAWLDGQPQVEASTPVTVTANAADLVQALISATTGAQFSNPQLQNDLLTWLSVASSAFQNGQTSTGNLMLAAYVQELFNGSGSGISALDAGPLIGGATDVLGCGPAGFELSAQPYEATVSRGGTAQYSLALTPTGGFKGPVQLSCSGSPNNGSCEVSEQTVTLDGITQQRFTLSVVTGVSGDMTAAAGLASAPPRSRFGFLEWLLMISVSLLSVAFLARSRRKYGVWLCLLLAVAIGGVSGCGSGGSGGGTTPPGVYTIFVHASSGNVSQTAEVTLNVK